MAPAELYQILQVHFTQVSAEIVFHQAETRAEKALALFKGNWIFLGLSNINRSLFSEHTALGGGGWYTRRGSPVGMLVPDHIGL